MMEESEGTGQCVDGIHRSNLQGDEDRCPSDAGEQENVAPYPNRGVSFSLGPSVRPRVQYFAGRNRNNDGRRNNRNDHHQQGRTSAPSVARPPLSPTMEHLPRLDTQHGRDQASHQVGSPVYELPPFSESLGTPPQSPEYRPQISRRSGQLDIMTSERIYQPPTSLHEICFTAKSAGEIRTFLLSPEARGCDPVVAAGRLDHRGRLPLHVISENLGISAALYDPDDHASSGAAALSPHSLSLSSTGSMSASPFGQAQHRYVSKFVIDVLLSSNPSGAALMDHTGCVPFERALRGWVDRIQQKPVPVARNQSLSSFSRRSNAAKDRIQNVWMSTSASVSTALNRVGLSLHLSQTSSSTRGIPINSSGATGDDDPSVVHNSNGNIHTNTNTNSNANANTNTNVRDEEQGVNGPTGSNGLNNGVSSPTIAGTAASPTTNNTNGNSQPPEFRFKLSNPVHLTSHAKFAIRMLSLILEHLDASTRSESFEQRVERQQAALQSDSFDADMNTYRDVPFRRSESMSDVATNMVKQLASIPNFIPIVLSLNDPDEFEWVVSTTLLKRVILRAESIGKWLPTSLQSQQKLVSAIGLHYLQLVSDGIEETAAATERHQQRFRLRGSTTPMPSFGKSRMEEVEELQHKLSAQESFIPSLLALDERSIEEAATTLIVRRVLDTMISRLFAVSVVFFDFLFLGILMVGFRVATDGFMTGKSPETILQWIYIANTGIFYFVIREIGKCITVLERTRQARIYLWSFWNITDIASTLLALIGTMTIRYNFSRNIDYDNIHVIRAMLAITTGFLWIRVLSLLKNINQQLATFVLAILQVRPASST